MRFYKDPGDNACFEFLEYGCKENEVEKGCTYNAAFKMCYKNKGGLANSTISQKSWVTFSKWSLYQYYISCIIFQMNEELQKYKDNHWRTSSSSKVLTVHGLINVGHEVTTYEGKPFRPICAYGIVQ